MKMSSAIRVALLALTAFAGAVLSSASHADEGSVSLTIYKAGWIIGGSGGGGVLNFRGRRYGLSTGGLDYGLVFGGSKTMLHGRVSNIYRPSDVAGVYGAAGAGRSHGRRWSVRRMSSGSPESATQRNGPFPSQKRGRM